MLEGFKTSCFPSDHFFQVTLQPCEVGMLFPNENLFDRANVIQKEGGLHDSANI